MSDLIVNVRQISQYTAQTQAQATDNLLIQRGGQGGAYYSLPVSGIVGAFTGPTGQIGIGLPLPGDASSTGIIGSNLLMPLGCTFGWNWYRTATGTSYLAAGPALQECFTAGGLVINSAATGSASAAIATWSQILNLTTAGALTIPGTITAAPATSTAQAATLGQVNAAVAAAVVSFNGRTGAVTLQLADVTTAGGAPNASPNLTGTPTAPTPAPTTNNTTLATTAYVTNAVAALQANSVTSFNARQGVVTLTTADITGAGGAPIASPALTGTPSAPTAVAGTNTTQLATTQFVTGAITTLQTNSVTSFNGRMGAVTLSLTDVTNAGGAPLASPAFSGLPNAPTAAPGTSTSQLATTAFVQAAVTASVGGVSSFNTRTGAVTLTAADITGAGGALTNSPAFTGTPTAPTAPNNTNTTQLATCAYVQNEIAGISAGVTSFNTRSGNVVLSLADVTSAGGAPQASPALSGIPTAPTAAPGTNTTQIATCAFVAASAAAGVTSFNSRTGAITLTNNDITAAGGLSNPNPNLLGIPTAPTATPGTNTTQLATTQFVTAAISPLTSTTVSAPPPPANPNRGSGWFNDNEQQLYIWNGSAWVIAVNPPVPNLAGYAPINSPTFTGTVTIPSGASIAGYLTTAAAATTYATLASPALTGNPTGVTQPPGDNDTSLATTAFTQTAVAPALNNVGRNLLHNALFNVQQRGAGPWAGGLGPDRWGTYGGAAGDTNSVQAIVLTDANRAAIGDEAARVAHYNNFVGGSGAANACVTNQTMEDIRRFGGKTVTVSFWASAGTAGLRFGVSLDQYFGSGGSPSATVLGAGQSVALTTTPTRYSFTFAIASTSGKTIGTNGNDYTAVNFWYSAGANSATRSGNVGVQSGNMWFWGAQCEIGSVMTQLEKKDPEVDLAQCQRFFCAGAATLLGTVASSGGYLATMVGLPVNMRAQPSTTFNTVSNTNGTGLLIGPAGNSGFLFYGQSTAAGALVNVSISYASTADL